MGKLTRAGKIESFDFVPGRILAGKYEVKSKIGEGWEAEVYLVQETETGIDRAAKFFYPHRNINNRAIKFYAKKLHKLRHCPILIQYLTQDTVVVKGIKVPFLVSEFVQGEILSNFIGRQPGKRLLPFAAVHLLYSLAEGIEAIHMMREYHGDLHASNIIVQRFGLGFDLKVLDFIEGQPPKPANIQDDVCDLIRIFYDALGGQKYYHGQPAAVKQIICGLKRNLILEKFKSAGKIKEYLKLMSWSSER